MPPVRYDLVSRISHLGHENGPSESELDALLNGIDLNAPDSDRRLLLTDVAWEGNAEAVSYLLKKGADANKSATPYVTGTALAHAVESSSSKPAVKAEIVKRLLAAGADPDPKIGDSGTLLDYMAAKAVHAARPRPNFTTDSQQHYKRMLKGYLATIPLLLAAGGTMSEASAKKLRRIMPKGKAKPFDPKKARALIKKGDRDAVYELCETHLANPAAVAHPEWSALVQAAIDSGRSFRKVAKEVYGKEVSMSDDEGWLCQSWEDYVTLDLVFELLSKDLAVRHPAWAELVAHGLERRNSLDATGSTEDALKALFELPAAQAHPAFRNLRALEERTT